MRLQQKNRAAPAQQYWKKFNKFSLRLKVIFDSPTPQLGREQARLAGNFYRNILAIFNPPPPH
jgi:hypothetical protein